MIVWLSVHLHGYDVPVQDITNICAVSKDYASTASYREECTGWYDLKPSCAWEYCTMKYDDIWTIDGLRIGKAVHGTYSLTMATSTIAVQNSLHSI
jgi:hypothetical protein